MTRNYNIEVSIQIIIACSSQFLASFLVRRHYSVLVHIMPLCYLFSYANPLYEELITVEQVFGAIITNSIIFMYGIFLSYHWLMNSIIVSIFTILNLSQIVKSTHLPLDTGYQITFILSSYVWTFVLYYYFEFKLRHEFAERIKNQENLENVKNILENLPDPIVVLNGDTIEYKNSKFMKTFSTKDMVDPVFISKETGVAYCLNDAAECDSNPIFQYQEEEYYEINKCSISFGKAKTELYTLKDISAFMKLEQTITDKKVEQMLTATMSHEMRNPLNAMLQMHDVMEPHVVGEEGRLLWKVSKNSCIFLLYLIHDMQDYFNLKQNIFVSKKSWFDLTDSMEDLVDLFTPNAGSKGVTIEFKQNLSLPRLIYND